MIYVKVWYCPGYGISPKHSCLVLSGHLAISGETKIATLIVWLIWTFSSILQGEDVIAVLPWDEWWEFELNKDNSNPHIALLPLHPDVRAKFNETAAWEYALSMKGKPYGYHNLIFSWIDTLDGNYPPPLDAHLVLKLSMLMLLL